MVAAMVLWPLHPLIAASNDQYPRVRFDEASLARAVHDVRLPQTLAEAEDWARVVALGAGREIILTTDGASESKLRMVAADQAGITVVDLLDKSLPDRAKRVLRDLLQRSPDALVRAARGGTVVRDGARIAPEGIYLEGRRVADLADVLQRVVRADIVEIRDDLEGASGRLMIVSMALVSAGVILHASSGGWRQPEPHINPGTILGGGMLVAGLVVGATTLKRGSVAGRSPVVYRRR